MDEFPDPDEEFDFVENHIYEPSKKAPVESNQSTIGNDFTSQHSSETLQIVNAIPSTSRTSTVPSEHNGDSISKEPKKRTYEELLEDIGDIFAADNFVYVPGQQDKRPRWNDSEAVIELILKERKKHTVDDNDDGTVGNVSGHRSSKGTMSTTVPSWNFVALTKLSDYERIYVRVRDRTKKNLELNGRSVSNLFAVPFSQLKSEAEEIILRNTERARLPPPVQGSTKTDNQLWVDKYRPCRYMELLTDESVNRACLRWLKLWDKVVFNRDLVKRKKPTSTQTFGYKKNFHKTEDEGVDARGFPVQRIALLTGPPGLGKTTLAHLVAKHAGYNVVEVNSSDDRGPEAFKEALLASTEMRSLMGTDPKPNCLILDEIDGAPANSIDLLIKYVQGKLQPKGKKNKDTGKKNDGCKRPVICICNEAYAPSLRPLRGMAFVIPVPKVSAARLADRLATIARKEKVQTDQGSLLQLAERSGCDVRSCLCALQYMGEACANTKFNLGLKDTKRGLFDCWKDVLKVPMNRGGFVPIRERVQIVLNATYSAETERLAQGVFHNYPETSPPKMDVISKSLEWYQLYDKITTVVMTRQDWRVMPYANYAFVAWHFGFASTQFIKLSYPYAPAEAKLKLKRSVAMLGATKQTYCRDMETLALDIVPFLPELLTPKLRSVSGHLYSSNERSDLVRLINVMLDLGLSFVLTNTDNRKSDYIYDPNLLEIGIFPDCKVHRTLSFDIKQIVSRELELESLRRAETRNEASRLKRSDGSDETWRKITRTKEKEVDEQTVPNHLRKLKATPVQPQETKYRNFFENFVPKGTNPDVRQKSPGTSPRAAKSIHRFRQVLMKHGVWYKYKEGFSNSVRRNVRMSDLL